jgi:acyl-CoA synthetase (AMP-forming)/AMP-acid ligase II
MEGSEARVLAPSGEELCDGQVGEFFIRSDSLFSGYYNRPDLTQQAFENGWYRTGDLGFRIDGEIYVIGRKRDLIIVAGKNIYPQDVEEIVCAHPAIHDGRAVAIGVLNPDLGTEDIIVVAEVDDEHDLSEPRALAIEAAVKGAVVAELGVAARAIYLKPPRWVVKSTAGKPARAATRDKLLAEHPELGSTDWGTR